MVTTVKHVIVRDGRIRFEKFRDDPGKPSEISLTTSHQLEDHIGFGCQRQVIHTLRTERTNKIRVETQ